MGTATGRDGHLNVLTAGFNIPAVQKKLLHVDSSTQGPLAHLGADVLGHVDVAGDVRQ